MLVITIYSAVADVSLNKSVDLSKIVSSDTMIMKKGKFYNKGYNINYFEKDKEHELEIKDDKICFSKVGGLPELKDKSVPLRISFTTSTTTKADNIDFSLATYLNLNEENCLPISKKNLYWLGYNSTVFRIDYWTSIIGAYVNTLTNGSLIYLSGGNTTGQYYTEVYDMHNHTVTDKSDMILYLTFDNSSNLSYNSVGLNNHGTNLGVTSGNDSKWEGAGFFNGSSKITTTNTDNTCEAGSYVWWMKRSSTEADPVFVHGDGTKKGSFNFDYSGGRPLLYLNTDNYRYWDLTTEDSDGQWHCWALVMDDCNSTDAHLYVDGMLISVNTDKNTDVPNAWTSIELGYNPVAGGIYFDGYLDEFQVYNSTLTNNQINNICEGNAQRNISLLNTSWEDDGSGTNNITMQYRTSNSKLNCSNTDFCIDFESSIKDRSINGFDHTMTLSNLEFDSTGGVDGSGTYNFNGVNSLLTVADSSYFDLKDKNVSISFWAKGGANANYIGFHFVGGSPGAGWTIYYEATGATRLTNRVELNNNTLSLSTGTDITDGDWHHVVYTLNDSSKTAKAYVDGEYKASDVFEILRDHNIDLKIGGTGGAGYWLNGSIDNFQIFPKTLTLTEIQALNNTGAGYDWSNWSNEYYPSTKTYGNTPGNYTQFKFNFYGNNTDPLFNYWEFSYGNFTDLLPCPDPNGLIWTNKSWYYVFWTWNNVVCSDLQGIEIYINGVNKGIHNQTYWRPTDLSPETKYNISIRTVDESGNRGNWTYNATDTWTGVTISEWNKMRGESMGSSLSITIFILVISSALYLLPFKTRFSKSDLLNMIIGRGCWIIATFFMTLNSAIMSTIATTAGIPVTGEMKMYMFIFGWAGYTLMLYLFLRTLFDSLKMWKENAKLNRTGFDD